MNITFKTGLAAILLLAISCKKENNIVQSSHITDITAKYNSIKIGTQKWMTKNLNVTRYRNGDKIPQVRDSAKWASLTTGAWCWYNNDSATGVIYGKLYNWYAVNDPRGLAPEGWHVPSDDEWTTLSQFLGWDVAGGKMKETGTTHWQYPNANATNSSGFTALPGGYRVYRSQFYVIGSYCYLWSSTEYNAGAYVRYLFYNSRFINRSYLNKLNGFSVRCIKDSVL